MSKRNLKIQNSIKIQKELERQKYTPQQLKEKEDGAGYYYSEEDTMASIVSKYKLAIPVVTTKVWNTERELEHKILEVEGNYYPPVGSVVTNLRTGKQHHVVASGYDNGSYLTISGFSSVSEGDYISFVQSKAIDSSLDNLTGQKLIQVQVATSQPGFNYNKELSQTVFMPVLPRRGDFIEDQAYQEWEVKKVVHEFHEEGVEITIHVRMS
jgi:hypothetical protein